MAKAIGIAAPPRDFGINFLVLDGRALKATEPYLDPSLIGDIHSTEAESVSDPGELVAGY